jgi:hypothetical protein
LQGPAEQKVRHAHLEPGAGDHQVAKLGVVADHLRQFPREPARARPIRRHPQPANALDPAAFLVLTDQLPQARDTGDQILPGESADGVDPLDPGRVPARQCPAFQWAIRVNTAGGGAVV